MNMGTRNANKKYFDITNNKSEEIITNENGMATFLVKATSVSIWVAK